MQEHLIEMCVGETLQVGQYRVRLVQIDGDELSIEIDDDDGGWENGSCENNYCEVEDAV